MTTYAEPEAAPAGAKVCTESIAVKDGKLSVKEFVARLGKPTYAEGIGQSHSLLEWWENGRYEPGWVVSLTFYPEFCDLWITDKFMGPYKNREIDMKAKISVGTHYGMARAERTATG